MICDLGQHATGKQLEVQVELQGVHMGPNEQNSIWKTASLAG